MKKKNFHYRFLVVSLCVSLGLGILFHDQYLLGSISLFFGCVQTLYTTKGKWFEAGIGILGTILSIIICLFAGLYGSIIFAVVIYIPLNIFNIISWKQHENNHVVELNRMTPLKSIFIVSLVIIGTALVGLLLSLIPTQKLAFWDACSNILNLAGILLIALRYKEGWIFWILCNFVEITTWSLALINNYSQNAMMLIIKNIIYVGLNVWGYLAFIKLRKQQETLKSTPITTKEVI
ncbi:MAG: nicotinamide mononucleotide transporter [Clostridia bacterium]|nr:nicotinamide mononucleotide transporter [Clostridia bacterium]